MKIYAPVYTAALAVVDRVALYAHCPDAQVIMDRFHAKPSLSCVIT